MKQLSRFLCLSTLSVAAATCNLSHADSMEFQLSTDMVEATYQADFGKNYNTRANWLHADQDNIKSDVVGLGLFASGQSGRFTSSLGGRAYWIEGEGSSRGHGVGLGGSVTFTIVPKFSIGAGLIFSPDIINGGDFDTYYDAEVRASFQVMNHASLFVAYRDSEAEVGKYDYDIYKGGSIGFKFAL